MCDIFYACLNENFMIHNCESVDKSEMNSSNSHKSSLKLSSRIAQAKRKHGSRVVQFAIKTLGPLRLAEIQICDTNEHWWKFQTQGFAIHKAKTLARPWHEATEPRRSNTDGWIPLSWALGATLVLAPAATASTGRHSGASPRCHGEY